MPYEAQALQFAYRQEAHLHQITRQLHRSLDESTILTQMLESIAEAVPVVYGNTASYRADLMRGSVIHHIARSPEADTASWLIPGHEFNGIYQQLQAHGTLRLCAPWLQKQEPWGSFCIALIADRLTHQGPLGDILLMRPKGDVFAPEEVAFIEAVAHEAAFAIANARRLAQTQAEAQELRHLLGVRDACMSALSDQMRAPLTTMRMAVQMVRQSPDSERRREYLHLLEDECKRGIELLNHLLQWQTSEESTTAGIQIQNWLPAIVNRYQEQAEGRGLVLSVDFGRRPLPPIYSDRFSLSLIIQDLLEGALAYAQAPGEVTVYVQEEVIDNQVGICIAISNPSTIPATELPHLFDAFYRVPGRERGERLGLHFIRRVISQLSGDVRASSSEGRTCFYVWVPQYLTLQSLSRLTGVDSLANVRPNSPGLLP